MFLTPLKASTVILHIQLWAGISQVRPSWHLVAKGGRETSKGQFDLLIVLKIDWKQNRHFVCVCVCVCFVLLTILSKRKDKFCSLFSKGKKLHNGQEVKFCPGKGQEHLRSCSFLFRQYQHACPLRHAFLPRESEQKNGQWLQLFHCLWLCFGDL